MALHDRGLEHAREHHEVTLGARGSIEDHPLARAIGASQQPTRQSVGESAGGRKRLLIRRSSRDGELRARLPRCRIGTGFEDRAAAHHPSLVDIRAQGVVDLLEQQRTEGVASLEDQPALLELLCEPSWPPALPTQTSLGRYRRSGAMITVARTRVSSVSAPCQGPGRCCVHAHRARKRDPPACGR